MIGFDEQVDLLQLLGGKLEREVECYAIGGTALLFLGLKDSTKDVDLVFEKEEERKEIRKALEKIGFKEPSKDGEFKIYRQNEAIRIEPLILEGHGSRFDLFLKDIISFKLSPAIKEDVEEKHEFEKLTVKVVSPEYILLLKCATDRKGDRLDAKKIIEGLNVDWDKIIEEAEWQTERGRKIFSVFLYDFLVEIEEDLSVEIPKKVMKKIRKIGERKMLDVLESKDDQE
ncbi:MAG: nucleotidyl transferase AbiEii/AbiGii toxin family protein [Candidatus Aenigmatarchaeota archaeon]